MGEIQLSKAWETEEKVGKKCESVFRQLDLCKAVTWPFVRTLVSAEHLLDFRQALDAIV